MSQDTAIEDLSFADLMANKDALSARLQVISIKKPPKPSTTSTSNSQTVPYSKKTTDTHWDYVLKEMKWLSADFEAERKRQISTGKKVATAVRQFHKTKETRRVRELAECEVKRRRLAAKLGRDVKAWWHKIERVVAYKQKISSEVERRKAMNKQLVTLVHQTERYGESIAIQHSDDDDTRQALTIEEALAAETTSSRRQSRVSTDYTRLDREQEHSDDFYGEATTSDSGSDGSFVPDDEVDDESTLVQAEAIELLERRRQRPASDDDDDESYYADPEELLKLQQESEMDVEKVMERFRQEAANAVESQPSAASEEEEEEEEEEQPPRNRRRVSFARNLRSSRQQASVGDVPTQPPARTTRARTRRNAVDPGNDADDDADASDVEDFSDDGSEEFEAMDEVDDETTIAAEERLGREMSAQDEIRLLQQESEMSIEELKKKYAGGGPQEAEEVTRSNPAPDIGVTRSRSRSMEEEDSDDNVASLLDQDDAEDEFRPVMEVDDETTIEAEERMGREMSHEQEMSLLQQDSEIPIEQLRAMYAEMSKDSDDESMMEEEETTQQQQSLSEMLQNGDSDDSGEFRPDGVSAVDDETTIEAEEKMGRDMSYQDEINLLKRESEMSVDELRRMYAGAQNGGSRQGGGHMDESVFDQDDKASEDEFRPTSEAVDDETTIEAEERLGREMSVEDEIALLQKESMTPVDNLRAMYNQMDVDEDENDTSDQEPAPANQYTGRKRNRSQMNGSDGDGDDGMAALKALRVAEERARTTTASRPYLLAPWVKLREYQQIGLNWLVSIQSRRLNAILADEMGLGKTLQTIALLAYLAAYKGIWGPHLVIVPTSCIVNWETEFKRFCPGLKVLCYYGTAKRRKELRSGWTKANWHHVIVTSYQLVVQDSFAFKRKKWYYMILDEAHNIKNFESQRWQTLINFNTQRRLLLTGTPLQNNLMELWSLLHFLMPHVFRSRKEFSYWFSNPMNSIIEGNSNRNDDLIGRLHGIIRPFVLRRLKKDVETQMPGKFEHIVRVPLSRRQMFLYEEFMARSSTRQALRKGGNFMGMMNVLMQLRKVCNHPDLFEPRSVVTPFIMQRLFLKTSGMVVEAPRDKTISQTLSEPLLHPLWCCSTGLTSQDIYLSHDSVASEQLCRLEERPDSFAKGVLDSDIEEPLPPAGAGSDLSALLTRIRGAARSDREARVDFQKRINTRRCRAPAFPYCSRLVNAVTVDKFPLDYEEPETVKGSQVISTPMHLLALRRDQQQRAEDLDDLMKNFVFCVPKVAAPRPLLDISVIDTRASTKSEKRAVMETLEEYYRPFEKARARLTSFFPDKKLLQFDAGKLQTLARLLRERKQGGHRVLIFSQMSTMLNILESFLNLNGHTYLRLDGSTGVDRRQRLMDRFNNDEKIFCFILSTRSGGLGINLTGADTVIFYDSDWNPAMDAQAQDRAHRIGQQREVHIFRLITEHSIEENILVKAQQKRNLDLLVMDEGKFDASNMKSGDADRSKAEPAGGDIYSKGGLRSILGIVPEDVVDDANEKQSGGADGEQEVTKEQMEQTMASLEDEDDVRAMRGAQKEVDDELKEFDESVQINNDEEEGSGENADEKETSQSDEKTGPDKQAEELEDKDKAESDEKEMEREFETLQNTVGIDATAINNSLSPTERYALHFREDIDPFYSIFAIAEYKRKMEAAESEDDIDLDELEHEKATEERRALEEGDLLGTHPPPEDLVRQKHLYWREKSRLRAEKKRRKLTGENWAKKKDGTTNLPFWYNADTGEAIWDKPQVLVDLEAYEVALKERWNAIPIRPLVRIMEYLIPFPERTNCSRVCRQWYTGATDISFVRHVYPAEMGALIQGDRQLEHNHFRSIQEALSIALPGDTIELGDGHYWITEPEFHVKFPIQIVGDEHEPSHVTVELSGVINWAAKGGWIEGVTFRRPRMASAQQNIPEILRIEKGGRVDIGYSVLENEGSESSVAVVNGPNSKGCWKNVDIRGSEGGAGISINSGGFLQMHKCNIMNNGGPGLSCSGESSFKMTECLVQGNIGGGVRLRGNSRGQLAKNRFVRNGSIIDKEVGCSCAPCNGNIAIVSSAQKAPPVGFRVVNESESKDESLPGHVQSAG